MFQAQKGPNGEPDVIALRARGPDLRPFHFTKLLESSVIGLDRPHLPSQVLPRAGGHRQVTRCPILRVTVAGDNPKH